MKLQTKIHLRMICRKLVKLAAFLIVGIMLIQRFPTIPIAISKHVHTFWKTEEIRHAIMMDIKVNYGLGILFESMILVVLFYRLFIKRGIAGLLKLRSLLMIAMSSSYSVFVLSSLLSIQSSRWFESFVSFLKTHSYSLVDLLLFGYREQLFAYFLLIAGIHCLAEVIVRVSRSRGSKKEQRIRRQEYSRYGIDKVLEALKKRYPFHATPDFYFDERVQDNALSFGNKIILGSVQDYETDSNSQLGIIAHEIGHFHYQDSFAEQISNACLTVVLLPLSICSTLVQLPLLIPGVRRIWGFVSLASKLIASITEGVITAVNKLFYVVSGRYQEKLADEFAAYLGFVKELVSALEENENYKKKMWDIHPCSKDRISHISI